MAQVSGIGGIFFRASDPEALTAWYQTHLGIGGSDTMWTQEAGPTVFAPFRQTSDYFPADKAWMLNLRVTDLAALIERLKAAGIVVEERAEWQGTEFGSFARIHDPEGTPIELWQPANDG